VENRAELAGSAIASITLQQEIEGRLVIGTEVEDMERFVPKKLARRMIFSKMASVFDLPGKFSPVEVGMKRDLRSSAELTSSWDDAVSE
jgi:hypothetical protein